MPMTPSAVLDSQETFNRQWNTEDVPACEEGMILLRRFAEAQPASFRVLAQHHFEVSGDPDLAASPEWRAFDRHFTDCENCNEM